MRTRQRIDSTRFGRLSSKKAVRDNDCGDGIDIEPYLDSFYFEAVGLFCFIMYF